MADKLRVGSGMEWSQEHRNQDDHPGHGMLLIQFFRALKSEEFNVFDGGIFPVPFWNVFWMSTELPACPLMT